MKHSTQVKELAAILQGDARIPEGWHARVLVNDDNLTYLVWNSKSREALVVDPVREDWDALVRETASLKDYRFIAVIDTHAHADHISNAAALADHLRVPLIQHHLSPSQRIHIRVSRDTALSTAAGPLRFLTTPGHTAECITPVWGPFLFGGDTLLFGDTGRDDLPGGDPKAHWHSIQKIHAAISPDTLILPGHDSEGGRASSWAHQREINPSLHQDLQTFVADAGSYVGPAPRLLKESLYENFK